MERLITTQTAKEVIEWAASQRRFTLQKIVHGKVIDPEIVIFRIKRVKDGVLIVRNLTPSDGMSQLECRRTEAKLLNKARIVTFSRADLKR